MGGAARVGRSQLGSAWKAVNEVEYRAESGASGEPVVLALNDLLRFSDERLQRVKIKFNHFNGETDPLDEYLADPDLVNNDWLFWRRSRRNFEVGDIAVNFLRLTDDAWLLTTIKEVTAELGVSGGTNYEGIELNEYRPYYGRLVLKHRKQYRSPVLHASKIIEQIEVAQLLPATFDGDDFPGYDSVCLSYRQLKALLDRNKRDWVAALEAQKAVYLITDLADGRQYVGSATGDNGMLLQRWRNYVKDGHGDNIRLTELVVEKGLAHIQQHFQYAILENYNQRVDKDFILSRERWWKKTLASGQFGYNAN